MKINTKSNIYKIIVPILTAILLVLPLFTLQTSAPVYAAGEQYKYLDPNTIEVSGGIFDEPTTLALGFSGIAGVQMYGSPASTGFPTSSGCVLKGFTVSIRTDNPGAGTAVYTGGEGQVITAPGEPTPNWCSTSFSRTENVRIGQLSQGPGRGGIDETPEQRRAVATYIPFGGDRPASDEFLLTGEGVSLRAAAARGTGADRGKYTAVFEDLDPGDYRVCSVNINPAACGDFTKTGTQQGGVTFRDPGAGGGGVTIIVRAAVVLDGSPAAPPVIDNSDGGTVISQSAFLNPDTVSIKKNGAVLASVQTENGVWTGTTAEYEGFIDSVPPDTYRACSALLDKCEGFTRVAAERARVVIEGEVEATDLDPVDDTLLGRLPGGEIENPDNCKGGNGAIDKFLGFIICPLVEGVLGVIHWGETNIIIPYLIVDPLGVEDDNAVFIMWQALRNVAFVLLVVAFMYLVFAETTSLGGEAYQLKRLAPRLVLVTVAIALSYTIIGLVIDFFNVLGLGIAQLTAWALNETGQTTLVTVEGDGAAVGLMALIAGTGALGLVSALLSGALAAPFIAIAAVTGVFIVLAVVITIILRQVVVLGLVIVSPLAFVALLLPNTESLFKKWWSVMTKALVMYPLIMLLFASGKIFGALIVTDAFSGAGTFDEATKSMLSFMANIAPMALIPFAFKMSGGVIGGAWGAMRGGIGKGRKGILGSEHNKRSILAKGREKSYKNMSERMGGQRGLLPRAPRWARRRMGKFGQRTPISQRAMKKLSSTSYIGGWMGGSERIASARAAAKKRQDELGATEIGKKRLEEQHMGSKPRKAVDPNATHRNHKGVPGYEAEAAREREDHQAQVELANKFGHDASYSGSDERNRFFAQDVQERLDNSEITSDEADELWEEYGRASEHINPLIHASIQAVGAQASREAFAADQSLDGATTDGVKADGSRHEGGLAGSGKAAIAEDLLTNAEVVKELVSGVARVGNADQVSPHSLTALQTVAKDPTSHVVAQLMDSESTRENIKQTIADLRGRTAGGGYNVSSEQNPVNQATADALQGMVDYYEAAGINPTKV